MKKKFLAMLLALTMALSLAACGGDSGTEEPSGSEDAGISAETVKIGLICVHDQNSGYDVAHIDGLTAACEELGIDREKFEKFDVNIHVPEGAIPKDGPSAGITMVTSLVSTFTGRPVRDRVAMTGETTLRGRVMPVGGIKEKILAAKRAGINEIILSEDNRKDISEIKPEYLEGLTFDYVRTNDDVLRLALSDR